jgi:fumarate reductase subunit D
MRHNTLLEFVLFLVQLIRPGALEDHAKEQEPLCTVVHLLVTRAVVLQDVIYDLYCAIGRAHQFQLIEERQGRMNLMQDLHDFEVCTTP